MKKIFLSILLSLFCASVWAQTPTFVISDTAQIPDGLICYPYGAGHKTFFTFSCFHSEDTIGSSEDILFLRMTLEHSWMADLSIRLICPSQDTVVIVPNYWSWTSEDGMVISQGTYLGIPLNDSGHSCDESLYPPGIGWDYIWSENTTNGYIYADGTTSPMGANNQVIHAMNSSPNGNGNTVYASDRTNMTRIYKPSQSFANLIGCPLNGTWIVETMDSWAVDNGYVFGCEMAFDERFEICQPPDDLAIDRIGGTYAMVTWDSVASAESYIVEYKSQMEEEYISSLHVTGNSCTLEDLTPQTIYDIRILTICEGNANSDYLTKSFSTEAEDTYFSITPSASTGGFIEPSSPVLVRKYDSQTFTFSNLEYYEMNVLWIDGLPIPWAETTNPYTISDVQKNYTIHVDFIVGVDDYAGGKSSVEIHPNPAQDMITVKTDAAFEKIEIVNLLGQTVYSTSHQNNITHIDISSFRPSVYLIRLTGEAGTITKKLVKE